MVLHRIIIFIVSPFLHVKLHLFTQILFSSLKRLLTVDSFRQPDLKVFVEHLASEGDSGREHAGVHEADSFAVHQEPVKTGQRKILRETSPFNPSAHVRSAPFSWIARNFRLLNWQSTDLGFSHYQIQGLVGVKLELLLAVVVVVVVIRRRPGEPRDVEVMMRTQG